MDSINFTNMVQWECQEVTIIQAQRQASKDHSQIRADYTVIRARMSSTNHTKTSTTPKCKGSHRMEKVTITNKLNLAYDVTMPKRQNRSLLC